MTPEKIVFRVFILAIVVIIFCLGWFFIGYYYGYKNSNQSNLKNVYYLDKQLSNDTITIILNKQNK